MDMSELKMGIEFDHRTNFALDFSDNGTQPMRGYLSFDDWKIDLNNYDYIKEKQNLERKLDVQPIEFDINTGTCIKPGDSFVNKRGSNVEISNYVDLKNVYCTITSHDPNGNVLRYLKRSRYDSFTTEQVQSPFDVAVYNTGYFGMDTFNRNDPMDMLFYDYWHDMMKRGCSKKLKERQPWYNNVTVDPYFWNFHNFYKWCKENFYQIPGEQMCVDKDILVKHNKIYSPKTCVFVPKAINSLFTKNDRNRNGLPIGVHFREKKRYSASISRTIGGVKKQSKLGSYATPEEAFNVYKAAKETEIKRVADLYRGKIPERLYLAMYNYQVEIDD